MRKKNTPLGRHQHNYMEQHEVLKLGQYFRQFLLLLSMTWLLEKLRTCAQAPFLSFCRRVSQFYGRNKIWGDLFLDLYGIEYCFSIPDFDQHSTISVYFQMTQDGVRPLSMANLCFIILCGNAYYTFAILASCQLSGMLGFEKQICYPKTFGWYFEFGFTGLKRVGGEMSATIHWMPIFQSSARNGLWLYVV